MKKILLPAVVAFSLTASAQNNTASDLIRGSNALVDLIRVFKTPKSNIAATQFAAASVADSCAVKSISDFCVKNNTGKPLLVNLYRRNGNIYETAVLSMRILPRAKEWLYELKSGVYKMVLQTEEEGTKKTFREGEVKINACENPVKTIQN